MRRLRIFVLPWLSLALVVCALIAAPAPVGACSPPDDEVLRLDPEQEESLELLNDLTSRPGAYALKLDIVAVTTEVPGFYRGGVQAAQQAWGPAPNDLGLGRVGSFEKRPDEECFFGRDSPRRGVSSLVLVDEDTRVQIIGFTAEEYLESKFGPPRSIEVDDVAVTAMIEEMNDARTVVSPPSTQWLPIAAVALGAMVCGVLAMRRRRVVP